MANRLALPALAACALAALFVGCKRTAPEKHWPAQGLVDSPHIGMALTFPPAGWRRFDKDDDEQLPHGHSRQNRFFRGGPTAPDLLLTVERLTLARNHGPRQFEILTDAEFLDRARGGAESMLRLFGDAVIDDCRVIYLGDRRLSRCTINLPKGGKGTGAQTVLSYFWAASDNDLGSASVVSRLDAVAAIEEIERILASLRENGQ